ncbi:MAG: MBL fold metallo-hydrolase [Deltaproteobacteria bacterium]|nr:MBL fold metallo-hydrolase [Deltaproteobacteria bacterium]
MRSGNFEIFEIVPSVFGLDGGAMFGIVPKPLWSKLYPADEMNRIEMAGRIFIVKHRDRNIIIETGMGEKFNEKFKNIYNIRVYNLSELLKIHGLTEELITDVIISHLHFDHAGGLSKREGNNIVPVYPNAKVYVQRVQFENAWNPSIKDRGSYVRDDFEFLFKYENLVLIDGEYELMNGFKIKPVNGHSPGMQTVYINTGENDFIFTADLVPTARHIRIPYVMAYDLNPLQTISEKISLLEDAVRRQAILLFPHDIFTSAARVIKNNGDFEIMEEVTL